jgi:hypothetical protein
MNNRILSVTSLMIFFVTQACKDKVSVETEQILKYWTGKTIDFPNIEPVYVFKTDTINITYT